MDDAIFISDVIKRLQYLQEKCGDLEVRKWDDSYLADINNVIYVEEIDDEEFLVIEL
ncbi:hypothetical protein [Clostridium sp. VAP51]|uniref:hypothetical protein n=1 Tax=Clostridium sp. VAP51 TaxID=2949978 RepID=UPI0020797735|nr:hypothetical protein [Clostridium sp. VAP51]